MLYRGTKKLDAPSVVQLIKWHESTQTIAESFSGGPFTDRLGRESNEFLHGRIPSDSGRALMPHAVARPFVIVKTIKAS